MARFRGTIKGMRGEASRLGSAKSGLTVEANGWDVGVRVVAMASEPDANGHGRIAGLTGDTFAVYVTGGSNKRGRLKLVGIFSEKDVDSGTEERKAS